MPENLAVTHVGLRENKGSKSAQWQPWGLDGLPTVVLTISSLLLDDSPRHAGESDEHVHVLTESEERLPPIVVHCPSRRVIDGRHRVRAAVMRGEDTIDAKIYSGTEGDAFVLGVRMNITHGLPLTRAERTMAALRIIGSHPRWSDRMIATATGLSAGTVAKVRQRSSGHNAQSATRVGKDGRERPLNTAVGRRKASDLLAERPTASIRAIATAAGVSPSTVHDVRQRLRAGQDPTARSQSLHRSPAPSRPPTVCPTRGVPDDPGSAEGVEVVSILATLKADPCLRFRDQGRSLLRCLDRYRVEMAQSHTITAMVPDHCAGSVATLAHSYARVWITVAALLEQRWSQQPS